MAQSREEELALRVQEEHQALNQLCQVVRGHMASAGPSYTPAWLTGLRTAFERVHAHFQRWVEIKERDGYLETALSFRPTLAKQVAAVKAEHGQLLQIAEAIRATLASVRPEDRLLLADACDRIERFIELMRQHEQRENMLVLFACNQDLGSD